MKSYELIAIGLILSVGIIEINSRVVRCDGCDEYVYLEDYEVYYKDWFKSWDDSVTDRNLTQTQLIRLHAAAVSSPGTYAHCSDGGNKYLWIRWTCNEGDREMSGTSFYTDFERWMEKRREESPE